jgi:CBS domain-containing protein
MRAPLTGVVFALELTHDMSALLPLLLAVTISYAFTVLVLKRSILTEKISRRGFHLSCEYSVDPLEIVFAREVMRKSIVALPREVTVEQAETAIRVNVGERNAQRLFPVIDSDRRLDGVVTRAQLRRWLDAPDRGRLLSAAGDRRPVVAYDDEPLRLIVYRMAETALTRLPVVSRADGTLVGMIGLGDLLTARAKTLDAESRRERVLGTKLRLPSIFGSLAKP